MKVLSLFLLLAASCKAGPTSYQASGGRDYNQSDARLRAYVVQSLISHETGGRENAVVEPLNECRYLVAVNDYNLLLLIDEVVPVTSKLAEVILDIQNTQLDRTKCMAYIYKRGNYLNNSFHNDIFDQNKLNKLRKTLSESGFDVNESQDDGDILSCLNDEIRSYYAGIRYYYDYVSELAVRQKRFYRSITQGTCEVTTGRLSTPRPSSEPPSSPEHSTATSPSESSPHPSSSSSPHPSPSSPHPSSSSPWTPSLQFLIERYRSRSGPRRPRGGF